MHKFLNRSVQNIKFKKRYNKIKAYWGELEREGKRNRGMSM